MLNQPNLLEITLIAAFAVYRLTLMLNAERGPGDIFERLRVWIGVKVDQYSNPYGTNWLSSGVLCFYCLSVWIAFGVTALALVALLANRTDIAFWLLFPFALSGVAVFLKKWTG